jgi:hypothetical protein
VDKIQKNNLTQCIQHRHKPWSFVCWLSCDVMHQDSCGSSQDGTGVFQIMRTNVAIESLPPLLRIMIRIPVRRPLTWLWIFLISFNYNRVLLNNQLRQHNFSSTIIFTFDAYEVEKSLNNSRINSCFGIPHFKIHNYSSFKSCIINVELKWKNLLITGEFECIERFSPQIKKLGLEFMSSFYAVTSFLYQIDLLLLFCILQAYGMALLLLFFIFVTVNTF